MAFRIKRNASYMAMAFLKICAMWRDKVRQMASFRCFAVFDGDTSACGKYHFERLRMFESKIVNQTARKTSSRENGLGPSKKCTGLFL